MGALDPAVPHAAARHSAASSPYPSRTKDPDPVDFSTGLRGPGRGGAAVRRARRRATCAPTSGGPADWPDRRFVAIVGDAELDEGNVWEAAVEEALGGSRQRHAGSWTSTARAWTGSSRASACTARRRCSRRPAGRCWRRSTAAGCRAVFALPGGEVLRRRIDEMSNEEYQALLRRPGAEAARAARSVARRAMTATASPRVLAGPTTPTCRRCSRTWAATTTRRAGRALLAMADADRTRPIGRSSPTPSRAGGCRSRATPLNHSALLNADQIEALAPALGADAADPWAALPRRLAGGPAGPRTAASCTATAAPDRTSPRGRSRRRHAVPAESTSGSPPRPAPRGAFGDALAALAPSPDARGRGS